MDTISYVLAMEEISKIDNSCSVLMSVNNSLVCWGLETYGTQEQKDKYLTRLATGEIIGAFCLSEPEAGSDATSALTSFNPTQGSPSSESPKSGGGRRAQRKEGGP